MSVGNGAGNKTSGKCLVCGGDEGSCLEVTRSLLAKSLSLEGLADDINDSAKELCDRLVCSGDKDLAELSRKIVERLGVFEEQSAKTCQAVTGVYEELVDLQKLLKKDPQCVLDRVR